MTKLRIVLREDRYFAQKKILNLFWMDMGYMDCTSISGKYPCGIQNPAYTLQLVENYIQYQIERLKHTKETVIQTYEF